MLEKYLQSQVMAWLTNHGFWFRRVPVQGVRGSKGARMKNPMAGMPDLIGLLPGGRLFAIELKTAEGTLSPIQEKTIAELEAKGALVIIARNLDDVSSLLLRQSVTI